VIIAGGAINSPQILLLSGIGPKKQLEEFSIPVVIDNPAVGSNLDNQIGAFLRFKTNASGLTEAHTLKTWPGWIKGLANWYLFGKGPLTKTAAEITGFLKTGLMSLKSDVPDLQLYFFNPFPWPDEFLHLTDEARRSINLNDISIGLISVLLHPSDKGGIRLRSADPFVHPIIDYNYLKNSNDADVLTKGLRILVDLIAKNPEFKQFDLKYAESSPVPGCEKYEILSDEYLKCSVLNRGMNLCHPVGTCRMGEKGKNSVVDKELKVHGIDGLRVVDASVFPDQVSGNPHAPVIMVAEKAADLIKKDAA